MEDGGDGSNQQHGRREVPDSVLDKITRGQITGDAFERRVSEEAMSPDGTGNEGQNPDTLPKMGTEHTELRPIYDN